MLQTYVMKASLYSCWLRFTKQEQTLYPGKPNNGKSSVRNFEIERQILKIIFPQKKKRPQNQNEINDLGVILLEK